MTTTQTQADMSGITVVEFEEAAPTEETYLSSELADGPPYTVHGVALGAGDVTKGKSGIKKKWPAEELQKAANSLQGTNLVIDHENTARGVIGRVTKAGYKDGTGVVYEAELYENDLADKVEKGLLEVSVRGLHDDVDNLEEDSESDALLVENIEFKNLSIVPSGASPSNTLAMGEHAELSAAELASFTEGIEAAELQEIEPGMWVRSDGTRGITISQVEDGEIEVDIYEESDGQWRSTGQTEMFDTDSLDEWDVDEEDIGPVDEDEEEEDSDSEEDEEENASVDDKVQWDDGSAQGVIVDRKTDGCFSEKIDGDQEICAGDDDPVALIEIVKDGERTGTMVAHKESTLNSADFSLQEDSSFEEGMMVEWESDASRFGEIVHKPRDEDFIMIEIMKEEDGEMVPTGNTVSAFPSDIKPRGGQSEEEMAAVDRGEFVKWKDMDSDWRYGQIIEVEQENQQFVATLRRFTESGDKLDETDEKPVQGLDRWDEGPHDESDVDTAETDTVSQEMQSASINDLINVLTAVASGSEENASTSKDVPTEDAQPEHEPMGEMAALFNEFLSSTGSPESTIAEFIEWMNSEELEHDRPEGADRKLDSKRAIQIMKEHDAAYRAFVSADTDDVEELQESFDDYPEAASENAQMALDAREETGNPNDCGTDVGWTRANQLANNESLSADTVKRMSQFARHRANSDQDPDEGRKDCGWMMWKAWGGDEGVNWAENKVDSENLQEDEEELQDYEMHTPDWSGTTESDWSTPDMEDFDTDDLSEIADHFLISATGFPPENFTDLKLPVVEPNGDLNVNALAAVKGGRGVSAVEGLSSDMEDEIVEWVNMTANEEFDRDWGMDEEEAAMDVPEDHRFSSKEDAMAMAEELDLEGAHQMEFDGETMWVPGESHDDYMDAVSEQSGHKDKDEDEMAHGDRTTGEATQASHVNGVRVLPGDDLQQMAGKSGESDADSLTQYKVTTMDEQIEAKLSELDDPVAVEAEELSTLQEKADRFGEMSDSIESLKERTDILDEVDRSQVEELAESDDPVVEESARYEELQSEAEQVKGVYAAQLSENYEAFTEEELSDKFSVEELREKFEDEFGSVEELAESSSTSSEDAEPRSQDPSEEELEEGSEEEQAEEELQDAVAKKQEEIRAKLGGN